MTPPDVDPTPVPPPPPGPSGPPPEGRSTLAVAALVAACLVCCPFSGAVSFILAWSALRRIRLSEGRLGGRRIALAAMTIGSVSLIGWYVLISWHGARQQVVMESMFAEAVQVTLDATPETRTLWLDSWPPMDAAQRESLLAFATTARQRYGRLLSVTVENIEVGGTQDPSRFDAALFLEFEQGRRPGAARLRASLSPTLSYTSGELLRLVIIDQQSGEMRFEVASPGSPASDVSERPESDTPSDGESGG